MAPPLGSCDMEAVRTIIGTEIDRAIRPLVEEVHDHKKTLYGNGQGLKSRVVALEVNDRARTWWTRTAIVIAATALAGTLKNWLGK